jgi:hypothetical protein
LPFFTIRLSCGVFRKIKRIGQDWLPAYGVWDAFVCPNSLPSLYVSASLADAAYFKSWLSPRRRSSSL